jgi:signal transduction histidine kinase
VRFGEFRQRLELENASRELKELDKEKSRFTANVHHELRTPLTLMLAPIDAFLSGDFGDISAQQSKYLKTMRSNGKRLLKLINNLLDFAKVESQQLKVRRVRLDVGGLVNEIVDGARPLADQERVSLSTSNLKSLPRVCVDPDAIEKVIVNILGNALKFTERDGHIRIDGWEPEGGGLRLAFRDDGVGLAPDQLDRIFDRFAQVDSSNTRRHEGTGIGLSLTRELVELHGGRIWAESEGLGRGAEIHLFLPEGEADACEEVAVLGYQVESSLGQRESTRAIDVGAGQEQRFGYGEFPVEIGVDGEALTRCSDEDIGLSGEALSRACLAEILVVEDNSDMRGLLRDILSSEYSVREACNGREGLDAVHEKRPDLILTDVMMPEMSGVELCEAIKGDEETRSIPLVLVTSKAEGDMKAQGLELGADDYVTKPFHPRELLARVRSLVRIHKLGSELSEQNDLLESTNMELETALAELKEASSRLVLSERLAAVGELAAGIAHEVNNPVNFATNALKTLRTYVGDIEMVASLVESRGNSDGSMDVVGLEEISEVMARVEFGEISKSLSELVGIATEGLDRTHRLVGDLRDFAAPNHSVDSDVNVVHSIESTIQLVRHSLRQGQVEVHLQAPDSRVTVRGQAHALNQVFLNLVKNAAEAIGEGGGNIYIGVEALEREVLVTVRDDGPGIMPDVQEKLFEPFFTTKSAGNGTGLGLSICRRIVVAHSGAIDVQSPVGGGAEFWIRLPATVRAGGDLAARN